MVFLIPAGTVQLCHPEIRLDCPTPFAGDCGYECQPRYRISLLRVFLVFLTSIRQGPDYYLKLGPSIPSPNQQSFISAYDAKKTELLTTLLNKLPVYNSP